MPAKTLDGAYRNLLMSQKIAYSLIAVILLCSCQGKLQSNPQKIGGKSMELKITSSAFDEGGMIPKQYTCDGANISPPLRWTSVPLGTKSLALICDDPDAPMGIWVHWIIFNLPTNINELPESIPPQKTLENGAKQGINDFPKIGYAGPCPPSGTHRYYFKLYALDTEIDLDAGATKRELLKAIKGHILAEGQLMGRYKR